MTDKYIIATFIIIALLALLRSVYVDQYLLKGQVKACEIRYQLLSDEMLKALDDADKSAELIATLRNESEKMKAKIIADEITKNREGFK